MLVMRGRETLSLTPYQAGPLAEFERCVADLSLLR